MIQFKKKFSHFLGAHTRAECNAMLQNIRLQLWLLGLWPVLITTGWREGHLAQLTSKFSASAQCSFWRNMLNAFISIKMHTKMHTWIPLILCFGFYLLFLLSFTLYFFGSRSGIRLPAFVWHEKVTVIIKQRKARRFNA